MHVYTATFLDGSTITRKTARPYAAAWRVGTVSGFSGSLAMAHRAAAQYKHGNPTLSEGCAIEVTADLTRKDLGKRKPAATEGEGA